ncbi:hypothetical protein K490DRAFT_54583 [Saccharata proteae CBS 121410]|uniref:Uncharacterized protein n=1 Tax=Saccharata proteae CBS 121410 TaxID=1314787 RepID=A0A9P4HYE5_9PEZI|nr:hypothetical protein K490DRAFT_54583 [Saccharata proteae CBS 121410]
MSGDGRAVVPIAELKARRKRLLFELENGIVSFAELARSWDITLDSVPLAINACNSSALRRNNQSPLLCLRQSSTPTESFIYTDSYLKYLIKGAEDVFEEAYEKAAPLAFPVDARLCRPLWPDIKNHVEQNLDGRCDTMADDLIFLPTNYLDRELEGKFEEIASESAEVNRYPNGDAVRDHIRSKYGERIILIADCAASTIWWKSLVQSMLEDLKGKDSIQVDSYFTQTRPNFRVFNKEAAIRAHAEVVSGAGDQGIVLGTVQLYPWVFKQEKLDQIRQSLVDDAVKLAEQLWESEITASNPSEHIRFQPESLLRPKYPQKPKMELPYPEILASDDDETIKTAFLSKLASLEAETTTQFLALWHDRISLRLEIYTRGCRAVTTDAKLQSQLTEVLRDYAHQELIPETISRAQTRRLIRSTKLKKNITKLQEALQKPSSQQTLDSVLASLQKFAAKMDIPAPNDEDVAAKKEAYVADLVSVARRKEGVVYATGKLAPKLLKTVKGELDVETGDRLEKLKEAVKAGKVGEGEREELRRLAAEL